MILSPSPRPFLSVVQCRDHMRQLIWEFGATPLATLQYQSRNSLSFLRSNQLKGTIDDWGNVKGPTIYLYIKETVKKHIKS